MACVISVYKAVSRKSGEAISGAGADSLIQ